MICQSCGVNVPDGTKFCPACGKRMSEEMKGSASLEQTADATEEHAKVLPGAVGTVPESLAAQTDAKTNATAQANANDTTHGQKSKKKLFITFAGVLALVLCTGLVLLSIHNGKQLRYNEGVTLLEEGKHSEAQVVFSELKTFDDSALLEDYSANMVNYEAALVLADSEKYKDAADAFTALGDFRDSSEQAMRCQNELIYINALDLYAAGDIQGAKDVFSSLGAFREAIAKADECDRILRTAEADALFEQGDFAGALILYEALLLNGGDSSIETKVYECQLGITYSEAKALFASGDYFDAYLKFSRIPYYRDAEARSKDCIQPFPETGELFHDDNYKTRSCALVIRTPADEISKNYIKIYSVTDDLVCAMAIGSGKSAKVWLPAGEYRIKYAYGGDWFGEDDLFGDTGTYCVLNNGFASGVFFKLESGYSYTLSLRTGNATDNNVDVMNEDRNSF